MPATCERWLLSAMRGRSGRQHERRRQGRECTQLIREGRITSLSPRRRHRNEPARRALILVEILLGDALHVRGRHLLHLLREGHVQASNRPTAIHSLISLGNRGRAVALVRIGRNVLLLHPRDSAAVTPSI